MEPEQTQKISLQERTDIDDTHSNSYELNSDAMANLEEIPEEIVIEEDIVIEDEDHLFERYESVSFKYYFDECSDIDTIIQALDYLKTKFESYKNTGHNLVHSVQDGCCFIDKVVE
jgi:hypothetical protein